MKERHEFYTLRYGILQGLYWASYCALNTFAVMYLSDKGYANDFIGFVLALGNLLAVFLQPFVASWLDRTKKMSVRGCICLFLVLMSVLSCLLFMVGNSVKCAAPVLFILISMMIQTIQPLNSMLGMDCENSGSKFNFGLARGMGSWSFTVASLFLGIFYEKHTIKTIPVIYLILFLLELAVTYTFIVKKKTADLSVTNNDIPKQSITEISGDNEACNKVKDFVIRYPKFVMMLVGIILLFIMHTFINNFAINMMENIGGNSRHMGFALAVAAFFELPAMACFAKCRSRFGIYNLMIFSCVAFVIKHIAFLFTTNVTLLIVLHSLQMLSYGIFLPASIYYVNSVIRKCDAIKGQTYVTIAITIGGILSNCIGGIVIEHYGFKTMMVIGTIVSIIGSFIISFSMEKIK